MKVGVLGAGGIVPPHLDAARQLGVEVAHIADVKTEPAEALAGQFGIGRVSADPADVVNDPEVDVVICALPTFLHLPWLTKCAAAGKHILTEKPLCRTVAQARRVIKTCERHGVKLAVGYQRRFSPARIRVREMVQSGAIGNPVTWVLSGFGSRSDFYRGPNNWMWDMEKGGGLVMDGSIHDFDFACWVLGRPVRMYSQSRLISDTVTAPTQASAVVTFESGDNLTYSVAWQEGDPVPGGEAPKVIGSKGTIINGPEFSFTHHDLSGNTTEFAPDPTHLFRDQLEAFLRYADGDSPDYRLTTGDQALASLWIAEKIVASGPEGRLVRFR